MDRRVSKSFSSSFCPFSKCNNDLYKTISLPIKELCSLTKSLEHEIKATPRSQQYTHAVAWGCVPHDWDFAGSFVLGSQRDTGVCPVAYLFDRLAVLYNRKMRLLIFTGVPQNECRFSDCS